MDTSSTYVAVRLLARSKVERDKGNLERAVELLESVITLGENDEAFRRQYPYLAAHINLYRIHRATGHDKEARGYFAKAIVLGATRKEIIED